MLPRIVHFIHPLWLKLQGRKIPVILSGFFAFVCQSNLKIRRPCLICEARTGSLFTACYTSSLGNLIFSCVSSTGQCVMYDWTSPVGSSIRIRIPIATLEMVVIVTMSENLRYQFNRSLPGASVTDDFLRLILTNGIFCGKLENLRDFLCSIRMFPS